VPELIRMAQDEVLYTAPPGSKAGWAPIHAWRALGQMEAQEAILPLLGLLHRIDEQEDEWLLSEIPSVMAQIGPSAIDPVIEYLVDSANPEHARICASSVLAEIAVCHPDHRHECVAGISAQLAHSAEQDESFNGFLICDLLDLDAREAAPIIEKAFAQKKVDEAIAGDWEGIQVLLGIKLGKQGSGFQPTKSFQKSKVPVSEEIDSRDPAIGEEARGVASEEPVTPSASKVGRVGRNDPCPCGSGRKFKKCCGS